MKLRNKKTGEIGWLYCDHISVPKKMTVFAEDKDLSANHWDYKTLAELNAEWEDMPEEEPKKYWRITDLGELKSVRLDQHHQNIEKCKDIGNYFSSREEAEKAVERLRAWKRLKDKGFKVTLRGWNGNAWLYANWGNLQGDYSDILLLFGGKEFGGEE